MGLVHDKSAIRLEAGVKHGISRCISPHQACCAIKRAAPAAPGCPLRTARHARTSRVTHAHVTHARHAYVPLTYYRCTAVQCAPRTRTPQRAPRTPLYAHPSTGPQQAKRTHIRPQFRLAARNERRAVCGVRHYSAGCHTRYRFHDRGRKMIEVAHDNVAAAKVWGSMR
jgi:hypothetical protein